MQVSAYITPDLFGKGCQRFQPRENHGFFTECYEDNGATRTESVLFDGKEQEKGLVFPVDKTGERECSVAKACREGEASMQVSACTQL
jgi:hypothetical protein